ncbi:FtsX-like permease family protein [Streptomyces sp. JH34]|uniref:FtsX-like permease family protein n=1 Tax=Streptomyces sp. JH34 TaxID=2793633 RepID=UPI003211EA01
MRTGTGNNGVYVTPANAAGAAVDRVDVTFREGADRPAVRALLETAGRDTDTPVTPRAAWVEAHHPRTGGNTRAGLLLILGIALLYTGIALAHTLVTATSDRVRELAVLRLTGATKPKVLRLVAAEALMVVAVGTVRRPVLGGHERLSSDVERLRAPMRRPVSRSRDTGSTPAVTPRRRGEERRASPSTGRGRLTARCCPGYGPPPVRRRAGPGWCTGTPPEAGSPR